MQSKSSGFIFCDVVFLMLDYLVRWYKKTYFPDKFSLMHYTYIL